MHYTAFSAVRFEDTRGKTRGGKGALPLEKQVVEIERAENDTGSTRPSD
jgi:hypothetical protein